MTNQVIFKTPKGVTIEMILDCSTIRATVNGVATPVTGTALVGRDRNLIPVTFGGRDTAIVVSPEAISAVKQLFAAREAAATAAALARVTEEDRQDWAAEKRHAEMRKRMYSRNSDH